MTWPILRPGRVLLAVEVEMGLRVGEDLGASRRRRRRSDCASRRAARCSAVLPSGRPQIGADMILELRGHRALDRPVAAIVHARRHLVEDRPPAGREKLDRQHADMVERVGDPAAERARLRRSLASRISAAPARSSVSRMPSCGMLRGASQTTISPSAPRQSRITENSASKRDRSASSTGRARRRIARPSRPLRIVRRRSIRAWPLPS